MLRLGLVSAANLRFTEKDVGGYFNMPRYDKITWWERAEGLLKYLKEEDL